MISEAADDFWHTCKVRLGPPLDQLVAFEVLVVVVVMRL